MRFSGQGWRAVRYEEGSRQLGNSPPGVRTLVLTALPLPPRGSKLLGTSGTLPCYSPLAPPHTLPLSPQSSPSPTLLLLRPFREGTSCHHLCQRCCYTRQQTSRRAWVPWPLSPKGIGYCQVCAELLLHHTTAHGRAHTQGLLPFSTPHSPFIGEVGWRGFISFSLLLGTYETHRCKSSKERPPESNPRSSDNGLDADPLRYERSTRVPHISVAIVSWLKQGRN